MCAKAKRKLDRSSGPGDADESSNSAGANLDGGIQHTSRRELVGDCLFWGICERPVMGFRLEVQAFCWAGGCCCCLVRASASQSLRSSQSTNRSIRQLRWSSTDPLPQMRNASPGPDVVRAALRLGRDCAAGCELNKGKVHGKGRDSRGGLVGWLGARLVFVGGEVRGQARPLQNKKKLGMHGRGLVSHLAVVGGEAVASGARGRWSPSLVLYSGREEVVGLVSAAVEGDGDATGGLEAVDRSSIVPVSCVLCSASGQQVGAAVQIPDFPRLWGKRVRAGDGCAGAAEGEFVRIGRIRPLIGGCWPGGSQWVGGALTAAARSTICINSTKKGSVTTACHAPAPGRHTTAEGSRVDVGPSCSPALQSCLEVLLSKYLQSSKCWRLWLAVGLALAPAA